MRKSTSERLGYYTSVVLFCIIAAGLIVLAVAAPERNIPMPKKNGTQQSGGTQGKPGNGSDNGLHPSIQYPTVVPEDK